MSETAVCMVYTTFGNAADARRIATGAVEGRHAACAQIHAIDSVYRWKGRIESEPEHKVCLKTALSRVPGLIAYLKARHPYEVPEIVVTRVTDGLAAYLEWVEAETTA